MQATSEYLTRRQFWSCHLNQGLKTVTSKMRVLLYLHQVHIEMTIKASFTRRNSILNGVKKREL